jgi:hypothetical protein
MDGRIGARGRPAIVGGQSSRSPKEREERRSPADSGIGDCLEFPCSQTAAIGDNRSLETAPQFSHWRL